MGCLENLSQLAILINCASIYFTSQVYHSIMIDKFDEDEAELHKNDK